MPPSIIFVSLKHVDASLITFDAITSFNHDVIAVSGLQKTQHKKEFDMPGFSLAIEVCNIVL